MSGIGARRSWGRQRNGPWRALFPGICAICSEPFPIGAMIARRKDQFMHSTCAPGGDE